MKSGQSERTNAMRLLEQKKVQFLVHDYTGSGVIAGDEVAAFLNEDPAIVFKTLVTVSKSGKYYVFMVPVCGELDLKKAAAAVKEKSIDMIPSKELLPLTGYIHGGCSPIGMKKLFPTVIDSTAEKAKKIFFSGGKIGLQVEMTLEDLKRIIPIKTADILKNAE